MKKIGIITTNNAVNYGAVLQAYSLKEALSSATGNEVETINYIGNPFTNGRKMYRKNSGVKNVLYNIIVLLSFRYRKNRMMLVELFDAFVKQYLSCSAVYSSKSQIEKEIQYDVLLCGSDQIWNLNLMDDDVYFLNFNPILCNPVRYSYAASVAEIMCKEQEEKIKNRLKHFQAISVREKNTALNLEKILKRKVNCNIDPVFLNDFEFWKKFSHSCKENVEPYILVFFIGRGKEDQVVVDSISKYYGLPTRQINLHPIKWVKTDFYFDTLAPDQFVKSIFEATIVVTDSFHATSFAIIGSVNFYNIRRSSRNSRIENLEETLGIPDRFIEGKKNESIDNIGSIDYNKVAVNIKKEQRKTQEYFQSMCGGCYD